MFLTHARLLPSAYNYSALAHTVCCIPNPSMGSILASAPLLASACSGPWLQLTLSPCPCGAPKPRVPLGTSWPPNHLYNHNSSFQSHPTESWSLSFPRFSSLLPIVHGCHSQGPSPLLSIGLKSYEATLKNYFAFLHMNSNDFRNHNKAILLPQIVPMELLFSLMSMLHKDKVQ